MNDIFTYHDYRKFLSAWFAHQKSVNRFFSYRYFASRVGIDAGNLVKILHGELHISPKRIDVLCNALSLSPRETAYFRLLVQYGKAKKEKQIKDLFEKILDMQVLESKLIAPCQYEYYSKWHHGAIAALLECGNYSNESCAEIAGTLHPSITVKEAKESMALLLSLGIIAKNESGFYKPVNHVVTTGEKWHSAAIADFQERMMELAIRSLRNDERSARDISMLTVTFSEEEFKEVRELTREFRSEILRIAKASTAPNRVFQINIQAFPLSKGIQSE